MIVMNEFLFLFIIFVASSIAYEIILFFEICDCDKNTLNKQLRCNKITIILNLILLIPFLNTLIFMLALVFNFILIIPKPFCLLLFGHSYNMRVYYYLKTFTILFGSPKLDWGYDSYKRHNKWS